MRRLIVDCQILQTRAFDRGMGKYTLSLLKEFLKRQRQYEKVELLFSSNLDNSSSRINYLNNFLGSYKSIMLDIPTDISQDIDKKYSQATEEFDKYIKASSEKNEETDFIIMSPFFVDFPAVFPSIKSVGKYSIVYDIIPQKIWHLLRIFPDEIYFKHFNILFGSDRLFTISESVKDDLINIVGIDKNRIQNIDGGPFNKYSTKELKKMDLKEPFLIYPSAPIVHKNNERAVKAFEKFNRRHNNKYTLYITSTFDLEQQDKLKRFTDKVVFTGNITDEELAYAYTKAEALYFPSLSEGLGMPVLEAVQYSVPVACSRIPVLSEISSKAFYQFDPNNQEDMVAALNDAVNKKDWNQKIESYKEVEKNYTWEKSAKQLIKGLAKKTSNNTNRQTIKLIVTDPSLDTPAGALAELLYGYLSEDYDVSVVVQEGHKSKRASFLKYVTSSYNKASYTITFKDKIRLRSRKVQIKFTDMHKTQQADIIARRIFKDSAVQLKGWDFFTKQGKPTTPAEVHKSFIAKEINKGL